MAIEFVTLRIFFLLSGFPKFLPENILSRDTFRPITGERKTFDGL